MSSDLKFLDEKLEQEKDYWLRKLSGELVMASLPLDFKRPKGFISVRSSVSFAIDREIQERLFKVCGANEALAFTMLLTALKILLYKDIAIEDPIVGTTIHEQHTKLSSLNKVLVLRDRVRDEMTIKELLLEVKSTLAEAYAHQNYPFDRILSLLSVKTPKNQAPLFSVAAVLENINKKENLKHSKHDLTFVFSISNGNVSSTIEYNPSLFLPATIELLAEHYQKVLRTALETPDAKIANVTLLSEAQQQEVIYAFNATQTDYPKDTTIHRLFEKQAAESPEKTAAVFHGQSLSYAELNSRANQIARRLQTIGVGPGSYAAVLLDHSLETVISLLGILKAGAAYVPLDPNHPEQRLAFTLKDAEAAVLLTERRLQGIVEFPAERVICLDEFEWTEEFVANLEVTVEPENLAYVIYTSGSTGKPKGVKVQHQSLVNYIWWGKEVYLQGRALDCALYSSLAFDLTVTSIFLPLISGNRVMIYVGEDQQRALEQILADDAVGVLKLTPSHLSIIKDRDNRASGIKCLIVGGEQFERRLAEEVRESFGPEIEIYNEYGPTEATVGCMIYRYQPEAERAFVAVGHPAANTQIYVLDKSLNPVAENALGDLYIAGDGLAEGYLNRAELTAERFIPNPFSLEPGKRMYASGDLARRLPEGELEYVGRRDEQVKYHGHRVELNEIRSALNSHPRIVDSVVLLAKERNGNDAMVAYYVAEDAIPSEELREFLATKIYEETIPNAWMRLAALPLTINGKVDHAALPSLSDVREHSQQGYLAPRTPLEEGIAKIWGEALGVQRVGVNDNFFDLGGHSLLATHVVSKVRQQFKVDIALRNLFEARTVARLSEMIEQRSVVDIQTIKPVPGIADLPLSFAQQRLWFMDQLESNSAAYNIPLAVRLEGKLDVSALQRSLNEVERRHEVLRTVFALDAEQQPVQVVQPWRERTLSVRQMAGETPAEREGAAYETASEDARRPFELQKGPLWRAELLRLEDETHILLLTMHHIISDGWSMAIFVREVATLYESFSAGAKSPLSDLAIQYSDFAQWQRGWLQGEVLEQQMNFWREQLSGELPVLELPTDHRRPRQQSFRGERQTFQLSATLSERLKQLSREQDATLFMTLLAGFQTLLHRYSGQNDIVVGTPIANRNRAEIEDLIGFFVNTLVLRTHLDGKQTFTALLNQVRETTLGAYAHQDVPFEKLVEELQPERDTSRHPFFQVMFIFQNAPVEKLQLPGLTIDPIENFSGSVKFDLVLNMHETEANLAGSVEYNADLFSATTIERMLGHLKTILESIAETPDTRLAELSLIGDAERQQLLDEWNAVDIKREPRCIHQIFERIVEQTPNALAIVSADETLTYAELNARANQIAHGLGSIGHRRAVAITLGNGVSQVATLLGVLKAGHHFVCLDANHPAARREQILWEIEPGFVISDATHFGATDATDLRTNVRPCDLAYIVYTSGSTGKPKGIAQSHDSFCQFVEWMGKEFRLATGKRVAQWASITYDASYAEIFGALCNGATLCLAPTDVRNDPQAMAKWLAAEDISLLITVPSFCNELLDALDRQTLPALEFMLLAGEALPPRLARRWLENYSHAKLYNLYGPTESVLATYYEVTHVAEEAHSIPVGQAIDGRQILVLDKHNNLSPIGIVGEVYIRSPFLTEGYWRNPEETSKRYLQNPLHDDYVDRVYRTGDLARWLPDGNLEFVGRVDNQVKVRGIRVELEEIESTLSRHENVDECAVIAQPHGDGDQRLVAYVIPNNGLTAASLREVAAELLPGYMVPSAFALVKELPRTKSGKIDRRALLKFETPENGHRESIAPRTPTELAIAQIWRELLRVDHVGVNDDFFHLGGHSLLATRVVNRLRGMYAVDLPLRDFITSPTIASVARTIERHRPTTSANTDRIAALLAKVNALSDEEVKALLAHQANV